MRSRPTTALALRLALGAALLAPAAFAQNEPHAGAYGVMRPTPEMHRQWHEDHLRMPRASSLLLDASGQAQADVVLPSKADVLGLLTYTPAERQQGSCGDCWVWGSTAMVEVALAKTYNIKDRLSIQFLNSAKTDKFACDGGSLSMFTRWYNAQKILVPWSNPNAEYRDGGVNDYCTKSLVDPATISHAPVYNLVSLTPSSLPESNTQDQMITAIKTALVGGQAVGFSYYTNFDAADGFTTGFWSKVDETGLWTNAYEGKTWEDGSWGGHMVTVVGYNAEDADPAKHYWIVLNSWGSSTKRPNGFFRMPIKMNYQATYTYTDGNPYPCYQFQLLDASITPAAPAAPTVNVTLSNPAPLVAQPLSLVAQVTGTPPLAYQWRKNGTAIPGATSAQLLLPCLTAADANQSYDVVVTNAVNAQTSNAVSFPVTGQNLLLNSGIEDETGWTATSSLGLKAWRIGATFAANAHSGSGYAYLGGAKADGTLDTACTFTQKVAVPSRAPGLTLSYWMRSSTGETPKTATTAKDTLTVSVLDEAGATLQTLKTYSNLDTPYLLWKQDSFDLSAYQGRTIQIQAKSDQDSANYSAFRLDDFGLVYGQQALGLSLSPKTGTVLGGSSAQLTATVTGSSTNAVNWSVSAGSLSQPTTTLASAANTWTFPVLSGPCTLTASLQEDASIKDVATYQVVAGTDINLAVSPLRATLLPSQQATFTASGDGGGGVTWTWDPALSVSPSALVAKVTAPATAPAQTQVYKAKVASALDASKFKEVVITLIATDLNQDGVLDLRDLLILGSEWGKTSSSPADLDGSGLVDELDVTALLGQLK